MLVCGVGPVLVLVCGVSAVLGVSACAWCECLYLCVA